MGTVYLRKQIPICLHTNNKYVQHCVLRVILRRQLLIRPTDTVSRDESEMSQHETPITFPTHSVTPPVNFCRGPFFHFPPQNSDNPQLDYHDYATRATSPLFSSCFRRPHCIRSVHSRSVFHVAAQQKDRTPQGVGHHLCRLISVRLCWIILPLQSK